MRMRRQKLRHLLAGLLQQVRQCVVAQQPILTTDFDRAQLRMLARTPIDKAFAAQNFVVPFERRHFYFL